MKCYSHVRFWPYFWSQSPNRLLLIDDWIWSGSTQNLFDYIRRIITFSLSGQSSTKSKNLLSILRWDTGDEKISTFAWGGAYAHRSSLDKYFSKISHKQNKSWIFLKQAKITTVAPFRSENSDFLMKLKIVGEVKLGSYTEAQTSILSALLEMVIEVSNFGERVYTGFQLQYKP